MNNSFGIDEKIDILYKYIREDGGIIDLPWCSELLYAYYKHFDDINSRHRVGSLIAFWGLLLEWEDGSGFPFYRGDEDYPCHDFKKYMESFIAHSSSIKSNFPNIHSIIIESLNNLDKKENFEDVFPNINKNFIYEIRKILSAEDIILNPYVYKNAFKEAGIQTK